MTTLHFLITIDQVNVLNLAGAEMLMRRARMIQKAINNVDNIPHGHELLSVSCYSPVTRGTQCAQ